MFLANKATAYLLSVFILAFSLLVFLVSVLSQSQTSWNEEEKAILLSLTLPQHIVSRSENVALARLGKDLFFDKSLSRNGQVACASCHQPDKYFTDGEKVAKAGLELTTRNTPTIVGLASSPWLFWDGRKDSLWSQALGPLEAAAEHGGTRMQYVRVISQVYRSEYKALFGDLADFSDLSRFPEQAGPVDNQEYKQAWQKMNELDRQQVNKVFINIGKAIAAYESQISLKPSRFDLYVDELNGNRLYQQGKPLGMESWLTEQEIVGLKLFMDDNKGQCLRCHNGPYFTNFDFQATGIASNKVDLGRASGAKQVLLDEFNCFKHNPKQACDDLRYIKHEGLELVSAFKVPSLRNVSKTAPYMHQGQLSTLTEVLSYYNTLEQKQGIHNELEALFLLPHELQQLEAFLNALDSDVIEPDFAVLATKVDLNLKQLKKEG